MCNRDSIGFIRRFVDQQIKNNKKMPIAKLNTYKSQIIW